MENNQVKYQNPLGKESIFSLLGKFAVPSIVALLVGSLYNIVDQFFIGRRVGPLGNAATNIAYPLSILCTGTGLLIGIGGASAINLALGRKKPDDAAFFMGNSSFLLVAFGFVIGLFAEVFLEPMMIAFGSPEDVLPYAMEYTRITAFGFPFFLLGIGGGHLLRADSRPSMTMLCNVSGTVINTFLDWLFVFKMGKGMQGAAIATVIGQFSAFVIVVLCLTRCRNFSLSFRHLILRIKYVLRIASLGFASFVNQSAMMLVMIVMNKSLNHYGSLSPYGEAIPIACIGIITKVNMVFMAFIIGMSQALQPIAGFNYGAKNFSRVKEAYFKTAGISFAFAFTAFLIFHIFPRQIISVFGNGSEAYFTFGVRCMKIITFFTSLSFLQALTGGFFTSIGKPLYGAFMSLTRQVLFLLPLILIFPLFLGGIDGIVFAFPVADCFAVICAIVMIYREFHRPEYLTQESEQ